MFIWKIPLPNLLSPLLILHNALVPALHCRVCRASCLIVQLRPLALYCLCIAYTSGIPTASTPLHKPLGSDVPCGECAVKHIRASASRAGLMQAAGLALPPWSKPVVSRFCTGQLSVKQDVLPNLNTYLNRKLQWTV